MMTGRKLSAIEPRVKESLVIENFLVPKQVDGSGLNHVYTPEVPDLTGILKFDKESSERPERRHFR